MAATGIPPQEEVPFRRNVLHNRQLSASEREALLKPLLPPEPSSTSSSSAPSRANSKRKRRSLSKPKKTPIRTFLHFLIYQTIALLFSIFFRFRRAWRLFWYKIRGVMRHHHHTPEWIMSDVKNLEQLPNHVSVVLDYNENDEDQGTAGLEGLLNDVCEIAAWTASAGIPMLSVYERTGILKNYQSETGNAIKTTLGSYFGPCRRPTVSVKAPHMDAYTPPSTPSSEPPESTSRSHLSILLLSEHDGRSTFVDLTRTLTGMVQRSEVRVDQINTKLINVELHDNVSPDPDLLILFSPTVVLKGYPPWQLRLTEIL
ncbi:Undecaprenyl diphosphate synthase [Massarina eburnea CBS 473.64]|uniref:ditrans,polycis-polyprenyl diphosphate synthase [(2E,6E)-farnesyldiphosphate specific] n=1 Tax=Massarina eburnea CBS 473.64 TaxID=1395130 RepID=A0A6A6RGR7_9PLEO|nr:Undecaprenyl diphosphate synthase [Massarina eburnea CBS 473.64]